MNPTFAPRTEGDWTVDPETGRSNSSVLFLELEARIAEILGCCRLGESPRAPARLILAQLAHVHGLAPLHRPPETTTRNRPHQVTVVRGSTGLAVYVNDHRVAGEKLWGGGTVLAELTATRENFDIALAQSNESSPEKRPR